MKLSLTQGVTVFLGTVAYFAFLYYVDKALQRQLKAWFRYTAAAVTAFAFFYAVQTYVPNHARGVEISKLAIAVTAAGCVFYEQYRKGQRRPIAERWKKFVGICLALAAVSCYFNGFKFGYPRYWHRWDQYHYYMGAKYFPELRYTDLYKCAVIAQDESGLVQYHLDRARGQKKAPRRVVDMRKEMRDPDKKVRSLGGENLLINVQGLLDHPEQCKDHFTPERWKEYVSDVRFFRIVSGKGYWTDMQKDHGYNPPPVWTMGGKFFSELAPSSVQFHQFLATLDVLYLIAAFLALYWGFGWRVFAVAAIFWGTQSSAPFYWTGGAFLRQDWLFFTALSVAAIRKRRFKIAGAALVYTGLLRIFPGLVLIGTLVPFITHIVTKKFIHRDHMQMLKGGVAAACVLLPLSVYMTDSHSYQDFYNHTLRTHDQTPLTNHMGLRVIIAHKFFDVQVPGSRSAKEAEVRAGGPKAAAWRKAFHRYSPIDVSVGKESGQMQWTRDNNLTDPFEVWKRMRIERYNDFKWLSYLVRLGSLAFFILVVRRIKSLWIAQCLGMIFIILGSQLTCYYYSFMILGAPLILARRQIEVGLYALAATTQIIWMNSFWNDNKYTLLTIASLIFCYLAIGFFWRQPGTVGSTSPAPTRDDDADREDDWEDDEEDDEDWEDDEDLAPAGA